MKLWLDDQIDDPTTPYRHTPEGWVGVRTALQACRLLATGEVTYISFDHDLGPSWAGSGYLVAKFIERRAFYRRIKRLRWDVHSANPIGAKNIENAMMRAETFWRRP